MMFQRGPCTGRVEDALVRGLLLNNVSDGTVLEISGKVDMFAGREFYHRRILRNKALDFFLRLARPPIEGVCCVTARRADCTLQSAQTHLAHSSF